MSESFQIEETAGGMVYVYFAVDMSSSMQASMKKSLIKAVVAAKKQFKDAFAAVRKSENKMQSCQAFRKNNFSKKIYHCILRRHRMLHCGCDVTPNRELRKKMLPEMWLKEYGIRVNQNVLFGERFAPWRRIDPPNRLPVR